MLPVLCIITSTDRERKKLYSVMLESIEPPNEEKRKYSVLGFSFANTRLDWYGVAHPASRIARKRRSFFIYSPVKFLEKL